MSKYDFEKVDVSSYLDSHSSPKSLEDRYLSEFKKDTNLYDKIKSLKLTNAEVKNGIIEILDYQEDSSVCKKCPGLENCPKQSPGYCLDLEKEDGRLVKTMSQCPKYLKKMRVSSRFLVREYPEEWNECYFETPTIDVTKDRTKAIKKLSAILNQEESKWLYIKSSHGSGASYLLACFANSYALKFDERIAFCDIGSQLSLLKGLQINDKANFDKKMELLFNCGCLILDGFGNEQKTDFAYSSILYPLLEKRARLNRLTIFASNFSLSEIEAMYAQKVSSERAVQLKELIQSKLESTITLTGINVY